MPSAIWGIDVKSQKVVNLAAGSNPTDAVNYQQLLDAIRGPDIKEPVRAATTTNITLSATQTIDGVTLAVGDRVLVKNQTTTSANGIYVVASGSWSRSSDADDSVEVSNGLSVAVLEGTTKGTGSTTANPLQYVLTTTGSITIGTTALAFSPLAAGGGAAYSPGTGILIASGVISIDPAYGKYNADLGAASAGTGQTITHNLGTRDVTVDVYEISTGIRQDGVYAITGLNTVSITFPAAISASVYRVVVKL